MIVAATVYKNRHTVTEMFLSIKNEESNVTERDRVQNKSEKWRESEQSLRGSFKAL
jgi:hypothetical protein